MVTASGAVRMNREGNYLAADEVVWDRKSGEVRAKGNVVVLTPQGDKLIGENVVLTDTLRDGTVDNLLVVLESGGRIAPRAGAATANVTALENAIYSPCPVTRWTGCPKLPELGNHHRAGDRRPRAADASISKGGGCGCSGSSSRYCRSSASPPAPAAPPAGWSRTSASRPARGFELAMPYHWQIGP